MVKATNAKEKQKSKFRRLLKKWLAFFGFISSYKAIHLYCISCCSGNRKGPAACEDITCELWPWRTGHSEISKIRRIFHRDKLTGKFRPVDTARKRKLEGILSIAERKGKTVITIEQKGENDTTDK